MEHIKRALPPVLTLALALALVLALTAALSNRRPGGRDLPMEIRVDGDAIVLGQTTVDDLVWWGWTAKLDGAQREIRAKDKFVAFHYRLYRDQNPDSRFQVSVYVPFQGNTAGGTVDISRERALAGTQGVVYRVEVRRDACEDLDTIYNGVDVQDLDTAAFRAWGGERMEGEDPAVYRLEAAQGVVEFRPSQEGGILSVTMDAAAFEKLQE